MHGHELVGGVIMSFVIGAGLGFYAAKIYFGL
jgi:hypothetical protein